MATERKKQQDRERMRRNRSEQAARIVELEGALVNLAGWVADNALKRPPELFDAFKAIGRAPEFKEMMRE